MHWWQSAFSSSPSSSSSSPSPSSKGHHDDSLGIVRRSSLKSDVVSLFSFRNRAHRLQSHHRRLTRSRRLRHLKDGDEVGNPEESPELWRSRSDLEQSPARSSAAAAPQPLPLPSRNSNLSSGRIPLPSPKKGGGEERERDYGDANGDGVTSNSNSDIALTLCFSCYCRLACQDVRRDTEHTEVQSSRKSPKNQNDGKMIRHNYRINIPFSAPNSPLASPAVSPQRSNGDYITSQYMSPQVYQVWSAPEMPPLDMNLGIGFSYHIPSEKAPSSVDSSPLPSPTVSPHRNVRSPVRSASPFHNRLHVETSPVRRETSAQANVHPLPLPPGAVMPSQPAHPPQPTAKPELMPSKSQWQKGKLIGRGTFGSVYVASNRETGALCAMKEVELVPDDPKSAECIRQLEQEIKVLSQLKHQNIVQYYGSETVGDRFYIYLEYVHPGSINKYVSEHCKAITESVVRNFTRHILSGLAYLHSAKTIHRSCVPSKCLKFHSRGPSLIINISRDIKGANLLVDVNGVVKLADFGMAKHLTGQAANLSLKGSPYWMAPELLHPVRHRDDSSDLALAVDIWSLGCTIIEMLNGKPPWSEFEGAAAMFKVLRETPPIPETLSPDGKDFLHCCFRRNPAERPSASMLLEHRFLKNSLQPDVQSCTLAFNGIKLTDNTHSQWERSNYRVDQLPVSKDARSTNGRLANNVTGQRFHRETFDLTVVPRHSPRSTLETLPSLSPPHLGHRTEHPGPSEYAPSSVGSREKDFFQGRGEFF
ncbi:hypothetical protein RJ639_042868 [Escallonia herrerae]|uniref:mitogen-activated protein kinase kinase kinase n=1 Tax=Escallonia herrerae TaxID=1293975 RepID=A0AA88WE29_9ASTE|nr:hypothetical protein RJ639_042868 [Escallonia herrerae]